MYVINPIGKIDLTVIYLHHSTKTWAIAGKGGDFKTNNWMIVKKCVRGVQE